MAITKEVIIDVKSEKAVKGIDNVTKSISKTDKELSKTKGGLQTITGLIDGATGGMVSKFKNVTKTIGDVKNGFGALRGAIIATGIGALVVIVTSLIEYFKNFEGGVKLITKTMDVFAGVVNSIVAGFDKLLSGDFSGFFGGIADGARTAAENVDKLFVAQKKLAEFNEKSTIANAKLRQEIEKQKKITEDTTLSLEKRLEAQEKINTNAEKLIKNERTITQLEKEKLTALLGNENNYEKQRELRQQLADVDAKLIDTETTLNTVIYDGERVKREITKAEDDRLKGIAEKRQQDIQQRIQVANQEKEAILKIEQDYKKQIEDLEERTDQERLDLAEKRAIAQLEQMKGSEADKLKAKLEIQAFYDAKEQELLTKKQTAIEAIQKSYEQKIQDSQDVTELQKLERQKIRALAELEALNATDLQKTELLQYYEGLRTNILKTEADKQLANDKAHKDMLIKAEDDLQNAKRNALDVGLNILMQFAGKNKAVALGILAIQKGLAIADVVVGASKSIAAATASAAPTPLNPAFIGPVPNPAFAVNALIAKKSILTTKIGAATNIASIIAAGISGAKSISGGGGSGLGGSVSAPSGGGSVSAPMFNVVGTSGQNQIAQTLGQQPPVQAYVVSGNVSTAQSLDRNIIQNASI
jgi:hypothetical protein